MSLNQWAQTAGVALPVYPGSAGMNSLLKMQIESTIKEDGTLVELENVISKLYACMKLQSTEKPFCCLNLGIILDLMLNVRNSRNFVQSCPSVLCYHFNLQQLDSAKVSNRKLTHCCTFSTSSILTPTLRVPRKCQAVSRGRFCIMMPANVTNSVSSGRRMV